MRDEEKKSVEYWDKIHDQDYDRNTISTDGWLIPFETYITGCHLPVLDLGCGSGNDTIFFIEHGKWVVACDQSQRAIENMRKNFPEAVEAKCFNLLEGLPFERDSFGIVCADLCLHYFREIDMRAILCDIQKVLVDGGFVFLRVNSVQDVLHGAGRGLEIEPNLYLTDDGMLKRFFDETEVKRLFSDFEILFCEEQKMLRYRDEKIVYTVCLRNRK